MSGDIAPKKIGRSYERNLNAGLFQPMVRSFDLHLLAEKPVSRRLLTPLESRARRHHWRPCRPATGTWRKRPSA
jgi:hypothetical protein